MCEHDWPPAIECLIRGIELSPYDGRLAVWYSMLANAYLQSGHFDKALSSAQLGCQSDQKNYLPRVMLIACHLVRRDRASAKQALDESLRVKPDLSDEEISHLVGQKIGAMIHRMRERHDASEAAGQ